MSGASEVADVLSRIAFGYELEDASFMRIRAYKNAARAVKKFGTRLPEAYASGELAEVPGLGKKTLEIVGLVLDGKPVPTLQKLETKIPPTLFEARRISGLGPKKILVLWQQLGLTSVGEIEYACNENRLIELDGFGFKTQEKVLASIAELRRTASTCRMDRGRAVAAAAVEALTAAGCRVRIAGEVRRGTEIVHRVDLVVVGVGDAPEQIDGVPVVVHRATPESFVVELVRWTADEEHLAALDARGFGDIETAADEDEVYTTLGLHTPPPERREGRVPVVPLDEPAPSKLVERADLKGAHHNHTTASDGVHSLEAMREAAAAAGLEYLGINDHSQSARYAGGLLPDDVAAQVEKIAELNAEGHPVRLLTGVESDILEDGGLDYEDDVLARLDVVVASVHNRARQDADAMTVRMVRAASHPHCAIVGHPTGRLIGGRPASAYDVAVFLDACAEHGTAVEHNANPARLDLNETHLAMAKERGVKVSIAADAHSTMALAHLDYGVIIARRAGLTADDVLNAQPYE